MKIAINGFGRIGRCVLRLVLEDPTVEVVAINGLSSVEELAYLFKYDSMQRSLPYEVETEDNYMIVNNRRIRVFREEDPNNLPWGELLVDIVFECTGVFNSSEKSMVHINKGAKHVLLSAPSKDKTKTVVYGVNDDIITKEDKIISCTSCTTNALAPLANIIHNNFKIKSGFMTTVHAMTNDQETLDVTHKKGMKQRRGRAASLNIIPTSTGAASQIGQIIPDLEGVMDGISYRVPVGDGSLVELNVVVKKKTTKEEVNNVIKENEDEALRYTEDPIVSSDIVGKVYASLVDGLLTNVINKNGDTIIKAVAWYDNEIGYSAQMIRVAKTLMSTYEEESFKQEEPGVLTENTEPTITNEPNISLSLNETNEISNSPSINETNETNEISNSPSLNVTNEMNEISASSQNEITEQPVEAPSLDILDDINNDSLLSDENEFDLASNVESIPVNSNDFEKNEEHAVSEEETSDQSMSFDNKAPESAVDLEQPKPDVTTISGINKILNSDTFEL